MSLQAGIDHLLSEAAKRGDIPGVAAMVTSSERTLYDGAFGVRSLARSEPMTIDTVVGIASMTKAITSSAALQLVERGSAPSRSVRILPRFEPGETVAAPARAKTGRRPAAGGS